VTIEYIQALCNCISSQQVINKRGMKEKNNTCVTMKRLLLNCV